MLTPTLALYAVLTTATAPDHGDLDWFEGDFVAALDAAEASGKVIFIDFWADW